MNVTFTIRFSDDLIGFPASWLDASGQIYKSQFRPWVLASFSYSRSSPEMMRFFWHKEKLPTSASPLVGVLFRCGTGFPVFPRARCRWPERSDAGARVPPTSPSLPPTSWVEAKLANRGQLYLIWWRMGPSYWSGPSVTRALRAAPTRSLVSPQEAINLVWV